MLPEFICVEWPVSLPLVTETLEMLTIDFDPGHIYHIARFVAMDYDTLWAYSRCHPSVLCFLLLLHFPGSTSTWMNALLVFCLPKQLTIVRENHEARRDDVIVHSDQPRPGPQSTLHSYFLLPGSSLILHSCPVSICLISILEETPSATV